MSEQIIYELNGIKYLMVELLFVNSTNERKVEAKCKRYGAIYQGIKEIHQGGLFSSKYVVVKFLVPEANIIEFNNDPD